jgi:hypothetical protein
MWIIDERAQAELLGPFLCMRAMAPLQELPGSFSGFSRIARGSNPETSDDDFTDNT